MNSNALPVAIVGAGFSGTLAAIHLSRLVPERPILLLEDGPEPGPGYAYSRDGGHRLLNLPARRMSAFPEDPTHFLRYACRVFGERIGAEDFLPRSVFGGYLMECLAEARKHAPRLEIDSRSVVDVRAAADGEGAHLTLRDGGSLHCARVLLATGNQGSAFAGSIWASHTLPARSPASYDQIKPGHRVLIVGTGLTMIEAVLELERRGLAERVVAVSRRGLLPYSHAAAAAVPAPELGELPDRGLRRSVREFRLAIARHQATGGDWRDLFAALRPVTPSLWQEMSSTDRGRFLRYLSPFWEVCRHQCAPAARRRLDHLLATGALTIERGSIVSVEGHDGRLRLGLATREHDTPVRWLLADHIIDATGPARDITTIAHPLIRNLLRRGFLRPDEHRLGAETALDYRTIQTNGRPCPWLYLVGPMLGARYFEASSVPELRLHAAAVAKRMAGELAADAPVMEGAVPGQNSPIGGTGGRSRESARKPGRIGAALSRTWVGSFQSRPALAFRL